VANYRRIAALVTARQLHAQVSRDADNDAVLACALAARADLLVSGDDNLLSLNSFNGIPIVTVAHAVKGFDATT
jgi:predicted nucleic acid-binding protein